MKNFNSNNALDFEASKRDLMERSQKRAWFVAITAVIIAVILAISIMALTPLKTTQPYVIKVNDSTGAAEIITVLNKKQIPESEALDKYFVNEYVKKREGYYYNILESDYIAVQLMSNTKLAAEYRTIYDGEYGRANRLKDNKEVEVKIISIVLNESAGTKIATIRSKIQTKDLTAADTIETSFKVITLSYKYMPKVEQTEQQRLYNPLGFTVTSYRLDNEVQ